MAQESVLPLRYGEVYTWQDCDAFDVIMNLGEANNVVQQKRSQGWVMLKTEAVDEIEKWPAGQGDTTYPQVVRKIAYILGHVHPEAVQAKRFVPANQFVPQSQPTQPREKPKSFHPYTKECSNCKQYILMDWNTEEGFVARDIATHQRHVD